MLKRQTRRVRRNQPIDIRIDFPEIEERGSSLRKKVLGIIGAFLLGFSTNMAYGYWEHHYVEKGQPVLAKVEKLNVGGNVPQCSSDLIEVHTSLGDANRNKRI